MHTAGGKQLVQEIIDDDTDTVISRLERGVQIVIPLRVQLIQKSLPLHVNVHSEELLLLVLLGTAVILFQSVDFSINLEGDFFGGKFKEIVLFLI